MVLWIESWMDLANWLAQGFRYVWAILVRWPCRIVCGEPVALQRRPIGRQRLLGHWEHKCQAATKVGFFQRAPYWQWSVLCWRQCGDSSSFLIGGAWKSLLVRGFSRAHGTLLSMAIRSKVAVAFIVLFPASTAAWCLGGRFGIP